jgi:membrane fusion protein (multidrug efflux system)
MCSSPSEPEIGMVAGAASYRISHPAIALLAVLGLCACEDAAQQAAAPPPPPAVSVISVQMRDVTPATEFVGRVVAADKVELRARVEGFLQKRKFAEGQDVAAGDALFLIEPEPFEAAVRQAEADLASAQADAHNAGLQLARAEQLVKKQTVAVATRDDRAADLAMAKARVQEAQASLEVARINLTYTEIRAPLAGRIGLSRYSEGNLVGPNSGTLAVIVSEDPIHVTFPVSQRVILEARRRLAEAGAHALVVRVKLPDGTDYAHTGLIDFVDIQINQGTDTATVRAEFPNPDRLLIDGAFVNVTIQRGDPVRSLLIPQSALQVDQAGPYALAVASDNKVEVRRLTISRSIGPDVIVEQGLKEGDLVIVEGIQKVRPGSVVAPTTVPSPTAGPAAAPPGSSS